MLLDVVATRFSYVAVLILLAIGLYAMFAKHNLIHKLIGMTVFQTAIFLFFIEGSVREGATAPVIVAELGSDPDAYVNPLPHLLILTAIVVGAGTLGVALSLAIRLHRAYGTLEEDELTVAMAPATADPEPGAGDDAADHRQHEGVHEATDDHGSGPA